MAFGRSDSWRRDTRPGVLVILSGLAVVCFAGLWAMLTFLPWLVAFDKGRVLDDRSLTNPLLDTIAVAFTTFGGFTIMAALTLAVCAWFLWRRMRPEASCLVSTMALGTALGELIKWSPVGFGRHSSMPGSRSRRPTASLGTCACELLFFGTVVFSS